MFALSTVVLAIAAFAHAHPPIHSRQLEGSCANLRLPTEAQYILGYQTFCFTYIPASPSPPYILSESHPLSATVNLFNHLGETVRWVYKISVADNTDLVPVYQLTRDRCEERFRGILETEGEKGGGGLGKAYCVVEGTGGEEMSGEGVVLVMGGVVKEKGQEGQNGFVHWETRGRLDD